MILLTVDEIIMIHDKLIDTTGGTPGLRDRGLLESAVFGVNASFGDVEQYPTVEEKSARLAFSLVSNHAFLDGNKRVGVLAMLMTLSLNTVPMHYKQTELIALGLAAANGTAKYNEILEWLIAHKEAES